MEEEEGRDEGRKGRGLKILRQRGRMIFVLVIGITAGAIIGGKWAADRNELQEQTSDFAYGLVENNVDVTDIVWREFPGYRNLSCEIQGTFEINVPKNAEVAVANLQAESDMKEIRRDHRVLSDGTKLLYYDNVTYEIGSGKIAVTGILKNRESDIGAAVSGYRVGISWETDEEIYLGYVAPESQSFQKWDMEKNAYADVNLSPYLNAFKLSCTYEDGNVLSIKKAADNVSLTKEEGGLLDCVLDNQGKLDWNYRADLPSLEMWYRGVWIELTSDFASNLTAKTCPAGESREFVIPKKTTDRYPDLFPGLYRLVVYGTDDDYIATEEFVISME